MKRTILGIGLALFILAIDAAARVAAPAYFYKVVTAEAQGFVFFADAETPAARVPVRLWDTRQRDFIYETFTNDDGSFELPQLNPGRYYVTFDTITLELEVVPKIAMLEQQPHEIIVIIPRGTASMPLVHLNGILIASTISEGALLYKNEKRQDVVSP